MSHANAEWTKYTTIDVRMPLKVWRALCYILVILGQINVVALNEKRIFFIILSIVYNILMTLVTLAYFSVHVTAFSFTLDEINIKSLTDLSQLTFICMNTAIIITMFCKGEKLSELRYHLDKLLTYKKATEEFTFDDSQNGYTWAQRIVIVSGTLVIPTLLNTWRVLHACFSMSRIFDIVLMVGLYANIWGHLLLFACSVYHVCELFYVENKHLKRKLEKDSMTENEWNSVKMNYEDLFDLVELIDDTYNIFIGLVFLMLFPVMCFSTFYTIYPRVNIDYFSMLVESMTITLIIVLYSSKLNHAVSVYMNSTNCSCCSGKNHAVLQIT